MATGYMTMGGGGPGSMPPASASGLQGNGSSADAGIAEAKLRASGISCGNLMGVWTVDASKAHTYTYVMPKAVAVILVATSGGFIGLFMGISASSMAGEGNDMMWVYISIGFAVLTLLAIAAMFRRASRAKQRALNMLWVISDEGCGYVVKDGAPDSGPQSEFFAWNRISNFQEHRFGCCTKIEVVHVLLPGVFVTVSQNGTSVSRDGRVVLTRDSSDFLRAARQAMAAAESRPITVTTHMPVMSHQQQQQQQQPVMGSMAKLRVFAAPASNPSMKKIVMLDPAAPFGETLAVLGASVGLPAAKTASLATEGAAPLLVDDFAHVQTNDTLLVA